MSMKFMSETDYTEFSDKETIDKLIESIVTSDQTKMIILLEPGVGFLAGYVTPFPFGPHLLATELAWYVSPEHRGNKIGPEFLKAFEFWAREKAGCTMVSMVCIDDRLDKFYNNEGYKLYERAYMKVL